MEDRRRWTAAAVVVVAAATAATLALASTTAVAPLFSKTKAHPGDRIVVRAGYAGNGGEVVVYLVPTWFRFVPLSYNGMPGARDGPPPAAAEPLRLGALAPAGGGAGELVFRVPSTAAGRYTLGVWCKTCGAGGTGTHWVMAQGNLAYDPHALLHVISDRCRPTRPNGRHAPVASFNHGNGRLFVVIPPDGLYDPGWGTIHGRALDAKIAWYSALGGGAVQIVARRLDGPAPVFRGHADPIGTGAQPSIVHFATGGCWRITASVGRISLSYVARVKTDLP